MNPKELLQLMMQMCREVQIAHSGAIKRERLQLTALKIVTAVQISDNALVGDRPVFTFEYSWMYGYLF